LLLAAGARERERRRGVCVEVPLSLSSRTGSDPFRRARAAGREDDEAPALPLRLSEEWGEAAAFVFPLFLPAP
jgi:hypothetical protein